MDDKSVGGNITYIDSNGIIQSLSKIIQIRQILKNTSKLIKTIGGFNSPLIFTKFGGFYIPHLWKVASGALKQDNQNKFKVMRNWFATQRFSKMLEIKNEEQRYIKINATKINGIPSSCKHTYYIKNLNLRIQTSGKIYQRDLRDLFIPATKRIKDLSANRKFKYTIDNTIKRVTAQTIIKEEIKKIFPFELAKLKGRQVLFLPKYNEELISIFLRLAFYEDRARISNPIPGGDDLDKLFRQKQKLWLSIRNPFKPKNDYTFLVMTSDQMTVLSRTIRSLEFLGKKNCFSAADISHHRSVAELTSSKLLVGKKKWSYHESIETGAFQGWSERGYSLPQSLKDLMVERGNGPLNYFLNGLIENIFFRQALSHEVRYLTMKKTKVNAVYTGSVTQSLKNRKGLTTIFMPDAATNQIPGIGSVEFWLYKYINNKWHIDYIIDLLKQQNSLKQPYRTFQINVYTRGSLLGLMVLSTKHRINLERIMKIYNVDGIIVVSVPKQLVHNYPRFAEIFNAARILYNKEYKQGKAVPHTQQIINDIVKKIMGFQSFKDDLTDLICEIKKVLRMFNFSSVNRNRFVLEVFWNYTDELMRHFNDKSNKA